MDFLRSRVGMHANRGGSQETPNCGACKKFVEHVPFDGGFHKDPFFFTVIFSH